MIKFMCEYNWWLCYSIENNDRDTIHSVPHGIQTSVSPHSVPQLILYYLVYITDFVFIASKAFLLATFSEVPMSKER